LSEDETGTVADQAEAPAIEAPSAEAPALAEESGGDQLSLDEMVESLRDPEGESEELSGGPAAEVSEQDTDTVAAPEGDTDTAAAPEGDTDTAAAPEGDTDTVAAPEGDTDTAAAPEGDTDTAAVEAVVIAVGDVPRLARERLGARLPFWLYAGAWLLFAAGMAIALWPEATAPFTAHPLYTWFVLGGAGLVVFGPIVALVAWLGLRAGSDTDARAGLLRALLLRASVALLGGSLLWWAALVVLDLRRAGLLG
jgi:hypothetical protein